MPKRTDLQKILIIGSGPIVIGQAYLIEKGFEVVLADPSDSRNKWH